MLSTLCRMTAHVSWWMVLVVCVAAILPLQAQTTTADKIAPPSSSAQRLYAAAKKDLLQLRVLLRNGRSQSTTGSGFLLGEGNLAVTNYHVISQIALEPETYVGEYVDTDGKKGTVELIAVDVLRDLAIVRVDRTGTGSFQLPDDLQALEQGEDLYSLGNPLDLGFAISEGTYNGISRRGFSDHLMFTGPLNPGMSGGPNITAAGDIAGVNVSHRRDGELVSFLVPARYLQQLVTTAQSRETPPTDFKPIIGEQLLEYQQVMMDHLLSEPLTSKTLGPYQIPVRESEQLRCWGNSEDNTQEGYTTDSIYCGMESVVFISGNLQTGRVSFDHQLIRSKKDNALRFSRLVSDSFSHQIWSSHRSEEVTAQQCTEEFVANDQLPMRAVLCASAYRKFAGLYNFTLLTITTDDALMSVKSLYELRGISYDNGMALTRKLLNAVTRQADSVNAENPVEEASVDEAPADETTEDETTANDKTGGEAE